MFNYLKEKLLSNTEDVEEHVEQKPEDPSQPQEPEPEQPSAEDEKEDKGVFSRVKDSVLKTTITEEGFEDLFWDIELALLENNVAQEVVDTVKQRLNEELVGSQIRRGTLQKTVLTGVEDAFRDAMITPEQTLLEETETHKPLKVVVIGINGSGKTTSIAKLAKHFQGNEKTVVMGAADTFRAAAIQQLQRHGESLDVKVISHDYKADPAAVAYDTVNHAEAQSKDVALIDTAGRIHTNKNLMEQLKKLIRVTKPDITLYVAESVTGNDCVNQVKAFSEDIEIDGVLMTKVDADEKGGAILSVGTVTEKPIYFLGTGQDYEDLQPFDANEVIEQIGLT